MTDYHDLQHPALDVLERPPSALDALRMIHKAHPALIRGASPLSASGRERDWTQRETYLDISGDALVTIALTDDGYDAFLTLSSISSGTRRHLGLISGWLIRLSAFFDRLSAVSDSPRQLPTAEAREGDKAEVAYLQSQDGNVFRSDPRPVGEDELAAFRPYLLRDIDWMVEAVGGTAEAVNLWIGTGASTTSLHHDPYDNVYHVLCGTKAFTLVSPIGGLALEQHFHPAATLRRDPSGSLVPELDADAPPVPWIESAYLPPAVQPMRVTVRAGETLFLPAGWWHRVEQEAGASGLAVAVNYWYTSELRPERYAYERFAARVARAAGRDGVIPVDPTDDGDNAWGSDSSVDSADEWDPADWGR
ncbi:hypothetical protein Q5752_002295 [Cryptotrichosporon argae]